MSINQERSHILHDKARDKRRRGMYNLMALTYQACHNRN